MAAHVTAGRIIVYAWKNFARNAWIALATIFVLVVALLSVNVLVGVNALLAQAVALLEEKIDISVAFKENTPEAVLQQASFFMAGLPQVKSTALLTPEQALAAFRERHAHDPKILEALQELDQNPLGATLVIKAKRTEDYPFLLEALKNPQFDFAIQSQTYDDHTEAIQKVQHIASSVRFGGLTLIAIFALFSLLIVYNAIRIAIYTQREEIKIMRLVGASGSFIRSPFVLEALLLACIALVCTAAIVTGGAMFIEPKLVAFLDGANPGLRLFFEEHAIRLFLFEGGGLAALVIFSSWAAVGKHLKR